MRRRLALIRAFLRGDPMDASGRAVVLVVTTLTIVTSVVVNVAGAVIAFNLLAVVLPTPVDLDGGSVYLRNLSALVLVLAVSLGVSAFTGVRWVVHTLRWLRDEREPFEDEREATLRLPLKAARRQVRWWVVATVVFVALNAPISLVLAAEVGMTVAIVGAGAAAMTYLFQERFVRPAVARALRAQPPERYRVPGVATRTLLTWALGTGLPVAGIAALGGFAFVLDVEPEELAVAAIVLAGAAVGAGLISMVVFARSIADPLKSVRDAIGQMQQGNLDVEVPVFDGSEVGFLQSSVNAMAAGLRERERLRDLFGRHVGAEVARSALDAGEVSLGGELRQVGVLFVDVVGSTAFTVEHGPAEVVGALNHFFGIVVDTVREHEGLINKFEGDAAMCVWGAPLPHDDPAGAALTAARELGDRLVASDALPAAVGVSSGAAVAGNVGAEDRLEYTVIGDPVNEAARLTELAKGLPGRVLASRAAVEAATGDEGARWKPDGERVVRGRPEPVEVAVPLGV